MPAFDIRVCVFPREAMKFFLNERKERRRRQPDDPRSNGGARESKRSNFKSWLFLQQMSDLLFVIHSDCPRLL
jgi:hypothetical protein